MTEDFEERYSRKEAAALLTGWGFPTAKSTLDTLATRGGGPKFSKWGRFVVYAESDLRAWVKSKIGPTFSSTAEFKRDDQ